MVGLEDQREAILLESFDQPALPQRLGAVELLGGDTCRELKQLLFGSGRWQRGVANVVLEVERRIIDPQRAAALERRVGELLAIARNQVQPASDVGKVLAEFGGWAVAYRD